MSCPKCKAKIGIVRQHFAIETEQIFGIACFICGYWVQEYPVCSGGSGRHQKRP
jgi:hypothetical protein